MILLLTDVGNAGSDEKGGQPIAFRDLRLGGRPSAMGGAYTAIAENATGLLYNPAGSADIRKFSVSFSYRAMHLDRNLGYAGVSIPAKEDANLSFTWIYAGTSDLEARDIQGNIIEGEAISYNENLFGINFSKKVTKTIMVGGKVFYAQNNIANISAYTVGVDLGTLAKFDMRKNALGKISPLLQIGLVAENIGAGYKWSTLDYWQTRGRERGATIEEPFPVNFRLGTAFSSPRKYIVAADFAVNTASMFKTHFGAEYSFNRALAFRAGLDDLHPTVGIGLFKKFESFAIWFDFSYLTDRTGEGDDVLASFDMVF
jgi:hypothetical protein